MEWVDITHFMAFQKESQKRLVWIKCQFLELHNKVMSSNGVVNGTSVDSELRGLGFDFEGVITPRNRERMSHSFKTIMDR